VRGTAYGSKTDVPWTCLGAAMDSDRIYRKNKQLICNIFEGSGSSVGIVTGYGLDGPGIESRWEGDFPQLSRPALGPTHPPVHRVPGLSRR
jgi:hypothetical protein